jgi:cytoskeletal protein CcmA (bactofilin family)
MFGGKKKEQETPPLPAMGEQPSLGVVGGGETVGRNFLRPDAATASVSRPAAQPEIARRPPDLSAYAPRRDTAPASRPEAESKKLIVGRDISLTGEIRTCDVLIVEGKVEASLSDCRSMEISQTGNVKGTATVEIAEISGEFDGDLTVQGRLFVRTTGRVQGKIRYHELEVERGGVISGSLELLKEGVRPSAE